MELPAPRVMLRAMQRRALGKTGVSVSRLAFGTMTFGGEADEAMSAKLFAACRDAGIDHFDTANVYTGGRSEEILGRLMAAERDELVIASKAFFPTADTPNACGTNRRHLVQAVEASLRRLGTDRIDLYYLHRYDESADLEETLRAMEHLVSSGKVLYPAVSNFAAWQITKSLGIAARCSYQPFVAVQPMFNLLKKQALVELLPMAASEGLAVIPYSPLAGGLLTGKYPGPNQGEGRVQRSDKYKARYAGDAYYDASLRFAALANEWGVHPVTAAIAWVADHPGVTAPLLGARNLEQLAPALAASQFTLSVDQRQALDLLTPAPPPATDRDEERVGL